MADSVNKRVNIWVNGKQVENNMKSIDAALAMVRNQIKKADVGSKEWLEKIEKFKKLKEISDDNTNALYGLNKELEKTPTIIESVKKWANDLQGTFQAVFFGKKLYNWIVNTSQEYVEAFATLDDAMASTQKYTGLTRKEVEALNEDLKKIDTRTSVEQLNKLAGDAGRLGITSRDQILEFVDAADKINVALGEDLGEDAVKNIGKMAQMFGDDKKMGLRAAMLATGSAINELAQNSSASEQYIMDFTARLSGAANQAGMTQAQIMGLASVLDQNMQQVEMSSTALQKLIMDMFAAPAKYAELAGQSVEDFTKLLKQDANEALLTIIDTLSKKGGLQDLAPIFQDIGLDGARASGVISVLAQNIDNIRGQQTLATQAVADGTSVMNEYNVVNKNTAAQLEKAKNAVAVARAELGEKLAPVLITITNGTAGFMKVLGSVAKVLLDNKASVIAAAAAYVTLYAIKSKNIIVGRAESAATKLQTIALRQHDAVKLKSIARTAQKTAMEKKAILTTQQETLALMKKRMETLKGIAADNQMKAVMAQEVVVKNAATLATRKQAQATTMATAATKAQKAAFASTPWGLIIMAVTAIATGIYKLATRTTAAEKAMKEFNKESAKEEAQARTLFSALKNTEKGTDDYKRILETLKELYPDIIQAHLDESGALENIDFAYKKVIASIRTKIALQAKEEAVTETMSAAIEKQKKGYDVFRKTLIKGGATTEIADLITAELSKVIENGEDTIGYIENLKKRYEDINFNKISWFDGIFTDARGIAVSIEYLGHSAENEIKSIDKSFSPFIENVSDGVDDLTSKISKLRSQLASAETSSDKKAIQKQIEEYRKQLEKLQSGKSTSAETTCTGDIATCQCPECKKTRQQNVAASVKERKDKRAAFDKELADFRAKSRIDQMNDWQKTKTQIETQYDEMIAKAIKFYGKESEISKQLESEKGDAIIKAGQDYLKKYADVLKKFEEETQKLAAKTDLSPEQSQMATEILGSKQEWDDKIAELQTNIDTIGDMVQDMDFDDENYAYFANMLSEMIDAQCAAITQKGEATANIVEKYARDAKAFVQTETSDLTKSQMSEYDRQIAAIDERYDTEIRKINETIFAKQKLMAEGGDPEELQAQIDELKALIAQMESLRKQNKARVPKEDDNFIQGKSTLERFLNVLKMSPAEFKDHWQEALSTTADAMQEWADTAFNIYSSIAQIQSNKDAAELQNYTDLQDAKSDALQNQYDQGLISEKYYNAQKDKIQADKEKKEKEIQHKEFERNKKASIVEATINGVLAAVKSFSDLGFPLGLIPMALSLATTGVQIAAIASQVNPYAKGGWIKQKQLILAGEEGEEWVASNKLLKDKKSKHVIEALEAYRQGNGSALDNVLKVPVPSPKKLSQSANSISRTFADNKSQVVNNNYYTSENGGGALLKEIRQMNKYLSDPKNRQAYITRKQQLEFEQQENDIKKYARL